MKKRIVCILSLMAFIFSMTLTAFATTGMVTEVDNEIEKIIRPTGLSYGDFVRFAELAGKERSAVNKDMQNAGMSDGKEIPVVGYRQKNNADATKVYVVNAVKLTGPNGVDSLGNNKWIVRLKYDGYNDDNCFQEVCYADFVVSTLKYAWDKINQSTKVPEGCPFSDEYEGTKMYGPCWYYYGLFDDNTHNICGYALAERINRWAKSDDLRYDSASGNLVPGSHNQFLPAGMTHNGVQYTGSYLEPSADDFLETHK